MKSNSKIEPQTLTKLKVEFPELYKEVIKSSLKSFTEKVWWEIERLIQEINTDEKIRSRTI